MISRHCKPKVIIFIFISRILSRVKMPSFVQFSIVFSILIIIIVNGEDSLLFTEDTLKDSHGSVIFSSVIFRHGKRAPTHQYPTDPYKKESYWKIYWPEGNGQLAKVGKIQTYNLGKWFRKRYESLISEGYRYDLLKIDSSDLDRTIMSAQCFIAGFLPPSTKETWTDDRLKWQPVPVRVIPAQLDSVIGFRVKCEKYEQEKEIASRSPEMKDYYFNHRDIFNYIANYSGLKIPSNNVFTAIDTAFYLYDILSVEKSYNLTLPTWTNSIYPEPLKTMSILSLSNIEYSYPMRRLKAGPLIGKLMEEMELKVQGKLNMKFHFYSGHDTTISGLLNALNIFNDNVPPYGASVFLELRRKEKDYVVTILYRNTTTSAPYFLQLPGCEYVCKLEDFKKLTEQLIPKNWRDECYINNDERKKFTQTEREIQNWPPKNFLSTKNIRNGNFSIP